MGALQVLTARRVGHDISRGRRIPAQRYRARNISIAEVNEPISQDRARFRKRFGMHNANSGHANRCCQSYRL